MMFADLLGFLTFQSKHYKNYKNFFLLHDFLRIKMIDQINGLFYVFLRIY